MPRPDEVDEDWLLTHDWILRRAILDDSYLPALDYLSDTFVGDEISTKLLHSNWKTQLGIVERVTQQIVAQSKSLSAARAALNRAIDEYAASQVQEDEGLFEKP